MESLLKQMDLWYSCPLGKALLLSESSELDKILAKFKAKYLLQIGGPSKQVLFQKKSSQHLIRLDTVRSSCPSIQGNFNELPFLPETLDVILLAHVLEFASDPKSIIREIYNALAPEGYCILLGFNPFSLWGLYKSFETKSQYPWQGHFWNTMHLTKWLTEQEFVIEDSKTIFFRPPSKNKDVLNRLLFLEAMGRLCWPSLGAVSIIVAKKKVYGLTPLKEQLHPI